MGRDFYTFAGENQTDDSNELNVERSMFGLDENGLVPFPARIAIYDDPTMTPRVVVIEPMDIHHFLEEISKNVYLLSNEQGGNFPFNIIREVVENYIHALFMEPTISIMDKGHKIVFSDRGPGIQNKDLALEIGASSATPQMKRYIRGVGSGLPIVKSYLHEKGGSITVQDNLSEGTVITIQLPHEDKDTQLNKIESSDYPTMNQMNYQPDPFQTSYPQQPGLPGVYPQPGYQYPGMQNGGYYQPSYNMAPNMAPQAYPQSNQMPYNPAPTQGYGQNVNQGQTDPYQMFANLNVSDRGKQALFVLQNIPNIGPSDLVRTYGGSNPTWSRALSELDGFGLTLKDGQKRHLTDFGRAYLAFLSN